ncbi:restriction endonuclease [Bremerella cremea]|uniref:Restriction endonuclease n=1 Tax=Bremerella cremea TaxID=1031537 RepID=A0A368KVA1_9BACT|nr:PaeR7I family type II restriction endonuclease [Bremerella cremea]RCS52651.1 restriction endonuclease [Bremerella cremea]
MSVDLGDFDKKTRRAVRLFWQARQSAADRQKDIGRSDQGTRAEVTAGKNMDGFVRLICDVVTSHGLPKSSLHLTSSLLTLPGFYRPTKRWDLLVTHAGRLIAAVEFKSQVGSFGNNFNNRTEEAIGTAVDLDTAYREGALGDQVKPFVGWMMLLEDCPKSRRPVNDRSPHFPVLEEFIGASYADRYHLLCKKLMQEKLCDAAAFMLSSKVHAAKGTYSEIDTMTSLRTFAAQLAGRVVAEIAS